MKVSAIRERLPPGAATRESPGRHIGGPAPSLSTVNPDWIRMALSATGNENDLKGNWNSTLECLLASFYKTLQNQRTFANAHVLYIVKRLRDIC